MSSFLWKAYYDDDPDAFQRALQALSAARQNVGFGGGGTSSAVRGGISIAAVGSPTGQSTSLSTTPGKSAARNAHGAYHSGARGELNARDPAGLTLLHSIASSTAENAVEFAAALIEQPFLDLYLQDWENGWTALHRAFYFGNITIARMILERDAADAFGGKVGGVSAHSPLGLVKVKDREGLGPLDLYAATIKDRTLRPEGVTGHRRSGSNGSDEERPVAMVGDGGAEEMEISIPSTNLNCDQLYTFGSNKNVSLGFGDEDDRQFPERINIRRPEHLLRRFYAEHLEQQDRKWAAHDPQFRPSQQTDRSKLAEMWVEDIPWMARGRPLIIQDVHMSKLHSAVLTTDPECNLYICGHGQGGRLGVGDERTRFNFVCIEGGALAGKHIATVALGLNHTLAVSTDGDIFSWGNNAFGQLGYSLPRSTTSDDDPISLLPRQIFGILKREIVHGVAASRLHSVVHTESALYTFGKNEGQLGIMDSDARSLEIQVTPRRVAAALFGAPISSVAAMDKATVCLLENHEVWVFANYGYAKVQFPLDGFSNYFLKQSFLVTQYDDSGPNRIIKLTCGGDTICALSSRGEIYTISISQRVENQASASTTNPAKIKNSIPPPLRIWSPKKSNMAARDAGVDADGSIILSTEEGSVWKRTKRATIKDASAAGITDYKPKDYKFSRIPGLTRVLAVRSSAWGAYAAIRRDCDVTQTQIVVDDQNLWHDFFDLMPLRRSTIGRAAEEDPDSETRHRLWQAHRKPTALQKLRRAILDCPDLEAELEDLGSSAFGDPSNKLDTIVCTTKSDVRIPMHRFLLTGRSRVMRRGFRDLCATSTFTIPDLAVSEIDSDGRTVIRFQGLDILTIVDLVFYLYTDGLVDFWHFTRNAPQMAHRYRQVRTELMKVATKLELTKLEPAARQMMEPRQCLDMDIAVAFHDPAFFHDGDIVVRLEDDEVRVHSALVCARCPFFEGLFMGRAGGRWVAGRSESDDDITVDLEDINARTFAIVLRHLYTDAGTELFDDVVSVGLDDFLDFVMDVMSAANELMIERLAQICQQIVGRFINVRNVCGLLNAISPSSVHEFKDAALEYLCLSLEAMLQGHYLNELDEDLLAELDVVVRENQLACMPFAKSGRAEMLLHERHPELSAVLERSRRAKIDAMTLRSKFQDFGTFGIGSVEDDALTPSPIHQKTRRRSSNVVRSGEHQLPTSPKLKAKSSTKDMLFAMDEEFDDRKSSPSQSPAMRPMSQGRNLPFDAAVSSSPSQQEEVWYNSRGKVLPSPRLGPQQPSTTPSGAATPRTLRSPHMGGRTPPASSGSAQQPWSLLTPLPGPKAGMKDIMAQASSTTTPVRTSTLSQGLAASDVLLPTSSASPFSLPSGAPKMSQKDRKRIQRSTTASPQQPAIEAKGDATVPPSSRPVAWQTVGGQRTSSLRDILGAQQQQQSSQQGRNSDAGAAAPASKPLATGRTTSTPQLTMRQTIANTKSAVGSPSNSSSNLSKPSVIGPGKDTKVIAPPRGVPSEGTTGPKPTTHLSPTSTATNSRPAAPPPQPQSIRHNAPPPDLGLLGLSMTEIVAAQQMEKDVVREAAAKRDLQDIQAEQEFEEWWRRESARVQAAAATPAANQGAGGEKKKGRSSRRRGGGGGGGVQGSSTTTEGVATIASDAAASKRAAAATGSGSGGKPGRRSHRGPSNKGEQAQAQQGGAGRGSGDTSIPP